MEEKNDVEESSGEEKKSPWKSTETLEEEFASLGKRTFTVEDLGLDDHLEVLTYQQLELKRQGEAYIDAFWKNQIRENAARPITDRSNLSCRMRLKGDSIYLEWYWNFWVQGKAKDGSPCRKPMSKHISRGKGYSYPIKTLLRHSAEWEYDLVVRTEEALTHIRRQNYYLAQARQAIREAAKSRAALDNIDALQKAS